MFGVAHVSPFRDTVFHSAREVEPRYVLAVACLTHVFLLTHDTRRSLLPRHKPENNAEDAGGDGTSGRRSLCQNRYRKFTDSRDADDLAACLKCCSEENIRNGASTLKICKKFHRRRPEASQEMFRREGAGE